MIRQILSVVLVAAFVAVPNIARADADAALATIFAPNVKPFVKYGTGAIAITNVRVVDGTGAPAREHQTVLINDGKIVASGPSASTSVPSDATKIDGAGQTLTPGIVGTHNHLYYVSGGPLFIMREMPYSFPKLYLASGVTTMRTAGSVEPLADLEVKSQIDRGVAVGPSIHPTSPYLTGKNDTYVQMLPLKDADDARKTVTFWADHGMTSFKIYTDITRAELAAVIETAHARGLKVMGHLCSIGFKEAAEMGIDELEHGLPVDSEFVKDKQPDVCPDDARSDDSLAKLSVGGPELTALVDTLVKHHVILSSTLAVFESFVANRPSIAKFRRAFDLLDPQTKIDVLYTRSRIGVAPGPEAQKSLEKEFAFERAFVKAGGLLTMGPDPTGYGAVVAGFGDQRCMELLVDAGFTPLEAISIATKNGAAALGMSDRIGTIAVGKDADLILVKGAPDKKIDDMENVETVFKKGVGYDSKALIDSVRGFVGRQ
jgi:imidazolonepropionase-like amidohydrolase